MAVALKADRVSTLRGSEFRVIQPLQAFPKSDDFPDSCRVDPDLSASKDYVPSPVSGSARPRNDAGPIRASRDQNPSQRENRAAAKPCSRFLPRGHFAPSPRDASDPQIGNSRECRRRGPRARVEDRSAVGQKRQETSAKKRSGMNTRGRFAEACSQTIPVIGPAGIFGCGQLPVAFQARACPQPEAASDLTGLRSGGCSGQHREPPACARDVPRHDGKGVPVVQIFARHPSG